MNELSKKYISEILLVTKPDAKEGLIRDIERHGEIVKIEDDHENLDLVWMRKYYHEDGFGGALTRGRLRRAGIAAFPA
jgi:hypothetical protein